jgi:hypothetical protein
VIELAVQWALWSKEPNDSREYRLLRSGDGPLPASELGRLISRHIPAQPPGSRQPGPAALPWLTFSPAPGDDGPAVGVSVLDLTDASDFSSRRIAPTRYLRLPFRALAAGPVTYTEMAAAATAVELPDQERGPLALTVRPTDAARLAESIDRLGFDRLAAAAGLVLNGRVVLLTVTPPKGSERVEVLDAIASLLPYGFRASLVASTWARQGNEQVRLGFGQDADPQCHVVQWDAGSVPPVSYDPGHGYLELLRQLRAKHGAERLVAHLAADGEPRTFDAPAGALVSLRRLDRLGVLSVEVHRGTADPGEVRAVLDSADGRAQPPEAVAPLTGFLLARGQSEDRPRVEQSWTLGLWRNLVVAASEELLSPDPAKRAWHLHLAARDGREEHLLVDLLESSRIRAYPVSRAAQAEVVRMARPLLTEARLQAGVTGWTTLAGHFGRNRELAYELLTQEVEEGGYDRLRAVLDWLRRGVGEDVTWLRPFRAALEPWLPALSEMDLREAAALDHRYALALLAIARRSGRAETALQGLWSWLLSVADELDSARRGRWLDELGQFNDHADQVRLDILRLRFGSPTAVPLRERLVEAGGAAALQYVEAFEQTYRAHSLDLIRPQVARSLIASIDGQRWTSPLALADHVLALLAIVYDGAPLAGADGQDVRAAVVRTVGNGAVADATLMELRAYVQRWAHLVAGDPRLAASSAVASLDRELRADLPIPRLAALCASVIASDRFAEFLTSLRTAPHPLTGDTVHAFLVDLANALRQRHLPETTISSVCESVARAVLDERLGRNLASAYRSWLSIELPETVRFAAWLLAEVKDNLTPAQLAVLRQAADNIQRTAQRPWTDRIPRFRR